MHRRIWRTQGAACSTGAAVLLAALAAGCGSSGGSPAGGGSSASTSASGATSSTASASASASAGGLAAPAAHFQKYVGGSSGKADASKSPITFGFINDQGGTVSFPEGTTAAQTAVEFVNDHLDGIDGHPVKLVQCLVATGESQGQTCAEQFRNDSSVLATVEGGLPVGAEAFHSTMAGAKPTIETVPNSPADATATNAYGLTSGLFGNIPGFLGGVESVHAKTASVLYPGDDPSGQLAAKAVKAALAAKGVKVTEAGYSSSASSLVAPAVASGAGHTDVVVTLFPAPSECIAGAKALQQVAASEPVVSLSTCAAPSVASSLGDLPKWIYFSQVDLNLAPSLSPDVASYDSVMKAYNGSSVNTSIFAQDSFLGVLTAVKMANQAGGANATSQTIGKALKMFKGPAPMGPPLKVGGEPHMPAILTSASKVYSYQGSGQWKALTGWIGG